MTWESDVSYDVPENNSTEDVIIEELKNDLATNLALSEAENGGFNETYGGWYYTKDNFVSNNTEYYYEFGVLDSSYDLNVTINLRASSTSYIVSTESTPIVGIDNLDGTTTYTNECNIQPDLGKLSCSYLIKIEQIVLSSWSIASYSLTE